VTAIEESVAVVTVSPVDPTTVLRVAEIEVGPALVELARPLVAATFEIVATVVSDDAQVTDAVMSFFELSE
jgi:hypothetical protein